MKKRILSLCLALAIMVPCINGWIAPVSAVGTITITQPRDNQWISYENPPRLEWDAYPGAGGYRVSIRNVRTDDLLCERKWVTTKYLQLSRYLDEAAGHYKIWVGAYASKSASVELASKIIEIYTTPEPPEIEDFVWEDATYDSITLSMCVTKNNGSTVTDCGFYIIENGQPTSEKVRHSFLDYGGYSVSSTGKNGYKEMTINGLQPDKEYRCCGYAVNERGETETSWRTVKTEKYDCPHTQGTFTNEYPEKVEYKNTGDAEDHKEVWYFNEYCNYCEELVKEFSKKETHYNAHEFVAGVCTLCNYAKACDHSETTKKYYDRTYTVVDENLHKRNDFYQPVCDDCGEITDPRPLFDTVEEAHSFVDDVCSGCGYENAKELSLSAIVGHNNAEIGDTLTVEAEASGGAGSYQYAFHVMYNGEILGETSYSNTSEWSYAATKSGTYQFRVYCKDGAGTVKTVYSDKISVTGSGAMVLVGSSASAKAGDTVDIALGITNNVGCKSLRFTLTYDDTKLSLKNVNCNTSIMDEADVLWSQTLDSTVVVNCFETENSSAVFEEDGTYVTLQFKVSEKAESGSYPIRISYDKNDVFDEQGRQIDLETMDGGIVVTSGSGSSHNPLEHVHKEERIRGRAATCMEDGLSDGIVCSECGEVLKEQQVIPATDHVEGRAKRENVVKETCETNGSYDSVTYCTSCGVEMSREQKTIMAYGHDYNSGVQIVAPTCETDGQVLYTCKNDSRHSYTEPITAVGHTADKAVKENQVDATCTASGSYDSVIYCTACGTEMDREEKLIDPTGHNWKTKTVAPTCTKQGYTTYTCSGCGGSYQDDYTAAKGHTPKTVKGYAATCVEEGLSDGSSCSVCGTVLTEQAVLPKADHTAGKAVRENEIIATCTNNGSYDSVIRCTVCSYEISRQHQIVKATGHKAATDKAEAATCTRPGLTEGSHCSACGMILIAQKVVPAVPHAEVVDPAVAATYWAAGRTEGKHCSVCKVVLVKQNVIEKRLPAVTKTAESVTIELTDLPGAVGVVIVAAYDAEGRMISSEFAAPDAAHKAAATLGEVSKINQVKLFCLTEKTVPVNKMLAVQIR